MAVFKCKMCGGMLEATQENIAVCDYCGSKQTLPSDKDEVIANLFNRANNLRLKNDFDSAFEIYSKILDKNDSDSEAHWGLVLCKYGIEYVEDPTTYKRIPTCHRTLYNSILTDADYIAAAENADPQSRAVYEEEAHNIAELQKSILNIVKNEKPFDVFICYKQTDENGKRTVDSALANDIYYQLTKENLRVFYSAITLEDKLGVEYEPYIFAALSTARVMLVIGTKPENFNGVWVKNEWSRYLKLMQTDRDKLLIPCFRDMDAYELPEEFAHLQAQDMSKIGFINDIVRGIKKLTAGEVMPEEKETVTEAANTSHGNTDALLRRAFMFLEDGKWNEADSYCEKVLDIEPENAKAYLGKLLCNLQIKTPEKLKYREGSFHNNDNYKKIERFGDEKLKSELRGYIDFINARNELQRKEKIYNETLNLMQNSNGDIPSLEKAINGFSQIPGFRDSDVLIQNAKTARRNAIYINAQGLLSARTPESLNEAKELFESLRDFKDATEKIAECEAVKAELEAEEKAKMLAREKAKAKKKKIAIASLSAITAVIIAIVVITKIIIPPSNYNKAIELMSKSNYEEAIVVFAELGDYKDSEEKFKECNYLQAEIFLKKGEKVKAAICFGNAGDYKDARDISFGLWDEIAVRETVSTGYNHTVGLKSDGTVVAADDNGNGQCNVEDWTDIIAVSAGDSHTVGLKSDGTVVATEYIDDPENDYDAYKGQCDVEEWTDIVAVSAGDLYTVGLKSDGTVVAVGYNYYGQCDVKDWTDIVAVSAGNRHTVGLKSDGTMVAVGYDDNGRCDVEEWTDIIAVSAGQYHTVGLKSDGTVVATEYIDDPDYQLDDYDGQCDVEEWTDIVAVSAGYRHTVGLKSDGTMVAVGWNLYGQCNVQDWPDIKTP